MPLVFRGGEQLVWTSAAALLRVFGGAYQALAGPRDRPYALFSSRIEWVSSDDGRHLVALGREGTWRDEPTVEIALIDCEALDRLREEECSAGISTRVDIICAPGALHRWVVPLTRAAGVHPVAAPAAFRAVGEVLFCLPHRNLSDPLAICSVRPAEGVVQVWSKRFAWLATAIPDREGNLCSPLAPHVVRDAATGDLVGIEGREPPRAVFTFGADGEDLDSSPGSP